MNELEDGVKKFAAGEEIKGTNKVRGLRWCWCVCAVRVSLSATVRMEQTYKSRPI